MEEGRTELWKKQRQKSKVGGVADQKRGLLRSASTDLPNNLQHTC